MGALSSFVAAWKLALTEHALLLPAFIYAVLSLPQMLLQLFYSGTGAVAAGAIYSLLLWLISPFFAGGLLATAAQALRTEVEVGSFLSNARRSYLYLLLAGVIYLIVAAAGVLVLVVSGVVLALTLRVLSSQELAIVAALLFVALGSVLLGLLLILLNFYDVGVAIDNLDPIRTFRNSFNFVRAHAVSVLGFILLSTFVVLLLYMPLMAVFFYHTLSALTQGAVQLEAGTLPAPGLKLGVLMVFLIILTNAIATCFTYTYRAVFYVQVSQGGS